jgi:superoxide dismutase
LYFASLGGDGRVVPEVLASAIAKDFGSVDRWRQEFVGIAAGMAGGSGQTFLMRAPPAVFRRCCRGCAKWAEEDRQGGSHSKLNIHFLKSQWLKIAVLHQT